MKKKTRSSIKYSPLIYNDKRSTLLEFYTQKRRCHADSVMWLLLTFIEHELHSITVFTTQLLCRFCTISLHICMKIMQIPFACNHSRSKYFKFIYLRSTFEHQNETNCSDFLNQQILANFAKQSNWTARLLYFVCLFVCWCCKFINRQVYSVESMKSTTIHTKIPLIFCKCGCCVCEWVCEWVILTFVVFL